MFMRGEGRDWFDFFVMVGRKCFEREKFFMGVGHLIWGATMSICKGIEVDSSEWKDLGSFHSKMSCVFVFFV